MIEPAHRGSAQMNKAGTYLLAFIYAAIVLIIYVGGLNIVNDFSREAISINFVVIYIVGVTVTYSFLYLLDCRSMPDLGASLKRRAAAASS